MIGKISCLLVRLRYNGVIKKAKGVSCMIKIDGNKIIADTKTQTALFVDGRLTELVSKLDGQRYLYDTAGGDVPISLVYACDRTLPIGKAEHCQVEIVVYSDYMVNLSFDAWNGHAELLIEEDRQTGAICVTPSAHTSRSGVLACRWELGGLANDMTMTLPLFQGFQTRLDDPMLDWQIFKEMHYPYRWEESFAIFGRDLGGMWVYCEGERNRFKHLRIANHDRPCRASFDAQNYGPIEDKLSAGGITWKINTYKGDWTVPVLQYRAMMMADPSWNKAKATLPEWFGDIKLAYSWCPTDGNILDTLQKYIDPRQVLIHLPRWRIYQYDQNYPDYTVSPEAKEFIRKGNEMGYHIAPHFNCYEIDPSLPEFELVRDFRYRDMEDGRVWGWGFKYNNTDWGIPEGNGVLRSSRHRNVMTKIHPALPAWRNLLAKNVKKAIDENDLHVVFLDTSHNTLNLRNELVNDTSTIEGVWDLFAMVEKINGGVVTGGEGMNETLLFQHFAQGHSIFNGPEQEMVPARNYVPVNHILFGDLCHLIGYHGQRTYERKLMQDECDSNRGFIPTLLINYIDDLDEKNSVSRRIIDRALG